MTSSPASTEAASTSLVRLSKGSTTVTTGSLASMASGTIRSAMAGSSKRSVAVLARRVPSWLPARFSTVAVKRRTKALLAALASAVAVAGPNANATVAPAAGSTGVGVPNVPLKFAVSRLLPAVVVRTVNVSSRNPAGTVSLITKSGVVPSGRVTRMS